ncbi:MAG TPA: PfkB family carbohydrate kinase [Bacteroidales bacterium]|nr:PfkB family carbohydrate kinase [Bacteroidales bacterium]
MTLSIDPHELHKAFSGKTILIVGDVMIDSYLWGKVDRISPEAPIPIVSVTHRENRLGGAANVALNIMELGSEPILCSVIGNDEKGRIFKDLLQQKKLSEAGIVIDVERKTTVKNRIISNNQHLLRVDDEVSHAISDKISDAIFRRIVKICKEKTVSAIIFEDYDKGVITPALIAKLTQFAVKNNIITAVDPKKRNFDKYYHVTLFKPNFKEFCDGLKCNIAKTDYDSLKEYAREFMSARQIQIMFITLSEEGVFITNGKEWHHLPAEKRDIADVSGAGDTVISTATLCLTAQLGILDTAKIANLAGGLVCEKSGVVPISISELIDEIKNAES